MMDASLQNRRLGRGLLLAGTALVVAGCGVRQNQFETEMAQVRQEMREGDEALERRVGERIDGVERGVDARMTAMENALGDLRDEFGATVERLESAIRFNAPIHFAFDDDEVRATDREVLDRFADVVSAYYADATITVEGFTDSAGSADYNRLLGMRRAESVVSYLEGRGLRADQMRAVSYGQEEARQIVPGAQGPGEEGWQNRRVAMVVDFSPRGTASPPVTMDDQGDGRN